MSASLENQSANPWYRDRWPWLLMAGPAIVVVAALFSAWLAVKHEDALVADDYYKQGLAINQEIRRDAAAAALDLRAQLVFADAKVRVFLSGPARLPGELALTLVHPTRAGLDRKAVLTKKGEGWYEGALPAVGRGRWHVILEDGARSWRLTGDWIAGEEASLRLAAAPPARTQR